jgi:hypothetical protein
LRYKLYDQELTKQEDYFKKELQRLKDEIPGNRGTMENTLIDELLSRFSDLQSKIKKERQRYEGDMDKNLKNAADVSYDKKFLKHRK